MGLAIYRDIIIYSDGVSKLMDGARMSDTNSPTFYR